METRFTLKDFILYALVISLGVVFVLGREQYDRQFALLQQLQTQSSEQSKDLAALRRQVERGIKTTGLISASAATTQPAINDPFGRIKTAAALPDYSTGDWLVDSLPNTAKLTPFVSGDIYAAEIQARTLQTLVAREPTTLAYLPMLAQPGWTIEDHLAEYHAFVDPKVAGGMKAEDVAKDPACPAPIRVTFQLRPNVTFSDGVPMTPDDVVWTFNWVENPNVAAAPTRSGLSKIRRVYRSGSSGVTFEFSRPYFDAVGLAGGLLILPKHFYEKYTPEQYNSSTGLVLGSGPYKLADPTAWKPGQQIELIRNDRYWGEPPALNKIVYRIMSADLPKLTAFTNGELDRFAAQPEQYKRLLDNADVSKRTNHFEYRTPASGYSFIGWNQKRDGKPTKYADKRVRQAMTLLTDRPRICDEVMLGMASIASGPFSPLGKQCDPKLSAWPYDVERAKAMLKDAGYIEDGGVLRGADGQPFTIKLTYGAGAAVSDRIVLTLRDSFARVGITLDPEKLDWATMKPRMAKRDFDAIMLGWSGDVEGDLFQIFHSSQIADEGSNFVSYADAALDKLIEKADETLDPDARISLWRQCDDLIHEDQPYTFLYTRKQTVFIANRIHNVQTVPLGLNSIFEWYVPNAVQKYQ